MYAAQESDPNLIEEAFSGSEKDEWTKAMQKEMESSIRTMFGISQNYQKDAKPLEVNGYSCANVMQIEM